MSQIGKTIRKGVAVPEESPVPIRKTVPVVEPERAPAKEPEKVPV